MPAEEDPHVASQKGRKQKRVLSGMRPTGMLHLGHYFGAVTNWIALQQDEDATCFFFSADWHALTTGYRDTGDIRRYRREMFADWIAMGLDPARVTLFSQAAVPEHGELSTLLGMITPVAWLERVPSYKEMRVALSHKDLSTIGFLSYPLLQTADIAMYRATHVPVGEDQLAHLEISREVLRRFNSYYGTVFPEPQGLVTPSKRVLGVDGRKMSKSYGNAVYLADSDEEVKNKIMPAPTDPQRVRRHDPGNPEVCNIFAYHKLVQATDAVDEVDQECRTAAIGCVDCKKRLLQALQTFRAPILETRQAVLASGEVDDLMAKGNDVARVEARETMAYVREAMGL